MVAHIKILLVDDHEIVRNGLRVLIEQQPSLKVIGEASSGEQALKMVREKQPDIVLMDIKMPGMGGLAATQRILGSFPDTKVIALTSYGEDPYPEQIVGKTGASGFLTKDCGQIELIDAINKVYNDEVDVYLSSKIAQHLAVRSVTQARNQVEGSEAESSALRILSKREMQVLFMISSGMRATEIAQKLNITSKTVNTYRYRLFNKLNVKSDVELTHLAIRHNLVDINDSIEQENKA